MAEIVLNSTNSVSDFRLKIIYTISTGKVTVTNIQGYRDSYGPSNDARNGNSITVTIGGTSQTWSNVWQYFGAASYTDMKQGNSTTALSSKAWSIPAGGSVSISASLTSQNSTITEKGSSYSAKTISGIPAVTYTISYSKGSYSNLTNMPSSSQTKTHGVNLTITSTTPYIDTPNVNGYVLTWNTNGGSGGDGTTTMKNTTRTTLTNWQSSNTGYSWAPGEQGFNENQDTTMTPKTFSAATVQTYGKLTALPTQPTRTNYTFLSWNTKADGTGYTLGTSSGYTLPYQPNANTTFYAIWKRNQASIKIKTGTSTWSDGLVWVKDSNGTWQQVLKVYVKTGASTWTESSD